MPKVNGFEFLEWKQGQPIFNDLPVVVWSSSDLDSDKEKAHKLGAVDYVVKPIFGRGLIDALEIIYKRLTEARAKASNSN